jgi:hypothetical protein
MKNMKKCLIWVVFGPPPRENDPTQTIFDGWRDLNPPKVYTKYENNPFEIVVCSLRISGGGGGRDQNLKTKVSPTTSGDTINLIIICTKI